ncbi:MAG: hypothetical protein K0S38_998, partial [Candidatus Paceibacter sp.]|nr:hypothetical protein [Candidatus Paceibacter sp.]
VMINLENRSGMWLITSFEKGPYSEMPQMTAIEGTYVCLPHKDTTGPQTDECALGIGRDQSDAFFALDLNEVGYDAIMGISTGQKIKVEGLLTPINQLSSNHWQKYNIDGIITVKTLTKI